MKALLYGADGKVGSALAPKLVEAGHEVTPAGRGDQPKRDGHDAAIDFTRPDAVRKNVEGCLQAGIPCVVGTTGMGPRGPRVVRRARAEAGHRLLRRAELRRRSGL